jgi:hypothetical protein
MLRACFMATLWDWPKFQNQRSWLCAVDVGLRRTICNCIWALIQTFTPVKKAHVALRTAKIDELRARIETAGYAIVADEDIGGCERFFSSDPFGNRVEFIGEAL